MCGGITAVKSLIANGRDSGTNNNALNLTTIITPRLIIVVIVIHRTCTGNT